MALSMETRPAAYAVIIEQGKLLMTHWVPEDRNLSPLWSLPGGGISLHSRRVEFEHPVRRSPVSVTAPVPAGDSLWAHFENP